MKTCFITAHEIIAQPSPSDNNKNPETTKSLTLIVLIAGTLVPIAAEHYGSYHEVFCQMFQNSLRLMSSKRSTRNSNDLTTDKVEERKPIKLISYVVIDELEYPSDEVLSQSNGLLITGSACSAYETTPWISRLTEFASCLPTQYPNLKLFGICFGHQIFAQALGGDGQVQKNQLGWELGVHSIQLSDLAKKFFEVKSDGKLRLHQLHQDHVVKLPSDCISLGSTPLSSIHGLIRYKPTLESESIDSIQAVTLLTVQGHPEFSPNLMNMTIDAREASGVFDTETASRGRERANEPDDGVWLAGQILKIMDI